MAFNATSRLLYCKFVLMVRLSWLLRMSSDTKWHGRRKFFAILWYANWLTSLIFEISSILILWTHLGNSSDDAVRSCSHVAVTKVCRLNKSTARNCMATNKVVEDIVNEITTEFFPQEYQNVSRGVMCAQGLRICPDTYVKFLFLISSSIKYCCGVCIKMTMWI